MILRHRSTDLRAEANERRSQAENRRMALFRLRLQLALKIRRPPTLEVDGEVVGYEPTERWRSRCKGGRLEINPTHEDFPALLSEALDLSAAREYDMKRTAELLGITSSQLTKLFRQYRPALEEVNARRAELGLRELR